MGVSLDEKLKLKMLFDEIKVRLSSGALLFSLILIAVQVYTDAMYVLHHVSVHVCIELVRSSRRELRAKAPTRDSLAKLHSTLDSIEQVFLSGLCNG